MPSPAPFLRQIYVPADAFECIDVSANIWAGGAAYTAGGRASDERTHGHPSTDRLDVIAP